jgi:hypothetical protein
MLVQPRPVKTWVGADADLAGARDRLKESTWLAWNHVRSVIVRQLAAAARESAMQYVELQRQCRGSR